MALYLGSSQKEKVILNGIVYTVNLFSAAHVVNGVRLLSSDGYVLKDSTGLYLTSNSDHKVEATNVLKGIAFESGRIVAEGVEENHPLYIRSGAFDISSLQSTTNTHRVYRFVVYGHDVDITHMEVYFYNDDGYVSAAGGWADYNAIYGFPDNALSALYNYNKYTTVKYARWSIRSTSNKAIRIAIYEIIDEAAVLIDECDINSILV